MTIHSDEHRSTEILFKQRSSELLSDPDELVRKFEELAVREGEYITKIEKLEEELKAVNQFAFEKKSVLSEQTKALGSARASLEAYRDENKRLKEDLKRVRGSSSLALGKALLSPIHSVKKLFESEEKRPDRPSSATSTPTESTKPSQAKSPDNIGKTRALAEIEMPESHASAVFSVGRNGETDQDGRLAKLAQSFNETRSAIDLAKLLTYQWYVCGMVSEPARVLARNNKVREALDTKTSILAARIVGAANMSEAQELIPARAKGPVYTPERERVMYCAHSTPMFNSNGYSTRTRGVVAGLAQAGIDVTVVARAGYPWDSAVDTVVPNETRYVSELDDVRYVHLPGPNLNNYPLDRYTIQAADSLVREAKLLRPSIIHAASNFRNALPALIAARRLGLPFVYEVRGLWEVTEASNKEGWDATERYSLMANLETLVATEADAILAITQEVADELIARGVTATKIKIAPNSVDSNSFLPLPVDAEYAKKRNIRTDVPTIGFAGSLVEYEGLDTLLEAGKILDEHDREFQIVIAGSGSYEAELRKKCDDERIRNVAFTGRVPIAEMRRLYSLFDIMPCPRKSLPVTEMVSPLKPLESFASSKAVVLSDVSPHRILAGKNEERALLFPAGNAEALAAVLERLIDDHELTEELGRRGRRWVRSSRSWTSLGLNIREWYREARDHYGNAIDIECRSLDQLKVGVIADEFTRKTLAGSVNAVPLGRRTWKNQLSEVKVDAVFIESAWEGNEGEWHRGVGYYGDDENRDLCDLISYCVARSIPTIFWNKEDPVHFNRFRRTAARFDFVFTTDANMVPLYLSTEWARTKVAASLPFYAQPKIHNPLPGEIPYDESVAYAGTYYGDRYKERSKTLTAILAAAQPYGLSIYDRQLAFADSPYSFPREFKANVKGALPYDAVIDSYKAHIAHLNVNSVVESPSMYSRRLVEIPASGGVVLSGPGRGIIETFGTTIPAMSDMQDWRALLHSWTTDPVERIAESWMQYRSVMRAHTVDTELTVMFRIAGIPVAGPALDTYSIVISNESDETIDDVIESLVSQSVLPHTVFVGSDVERVREYFAGTAVLVQTLDKVEATASDWIGVLSGPVPRTHFEDLLYAGRFGNWTRITAKQASWTDRGSTIARRVNQTTSKEGLIRTSEVNLTKSLYSQLSVTTGSIIEWIVPRLRLEDGNAAPVCTEHSATELTVVVASHDLKFADNIIDELRSAGHRVLIDKWESHTSHDEATSRQLLDRADVIFCEWGLGNAVWYSKNKLPHQRLVIRVHSQELRRPYLQELTMVNVDAFVFVGELTRQAAISGHNIPANKTFVIPNFVDNDGLKQPKYSKTEKNLGLVGIVPKSKRMDRALDILEKLLEVDTEYRLFVKGKGTGDYPWLKNRPDEIEYYDAQYARVESINRRFPGSVIFDKFSSDMSEWYRKIGAVLSVSDFESFHYTIPDGAASGAEPFCLAWPGADLLYPDDWVYDSIDDIVSAISQRQPGSEDANRQFVSAYFNGQESTALLLNMIVGGSSPLK
ncbi:glycosyltransferase [Brevibacterium sp. 'Marine']|uniref:glycosyltransferase n=1 Tax=Brevibacterium sp. 'Marine' TaxID=2725563 RepID=UPI00145E04DD|nr:glycosyltransferase [Brevibacterium sp. 'Marine']